MTTRFLLVRIVFLLAAGSSTAAQSLHWKAWGDSGTATDLGDRRQGFALALAGDVDGDGIVDLLSGAPNRFHYDWDQDWQLPGMVTVLSGASGAVLRSYSTPGSNADRFGYSLLGAEDFDNDGIPDHAIGAPLGDDSMIDAGLVRVFSGVDGHFLYDCAGSTTGDQLGTAIALLDDIDGDGVRDLAAGAAGGSYLRLFSGAQGSYRGQISWVTGTGFGSSIAAVGDIDGDGAGEFLVGAPFSDVGGLDSGTAVLYAGATRSVLHSFHGTTSVRLGSSVAALGDVDGDQIPDFGMAGIGHARVISGATLQPVPVVSVAAENPGSDHSGVDLKTATIAALGDIDADGYDDVAIAGGSRVSFVSGKTGALLARPCSGTVPIDRGQNPSSFGWSILAAGDIDSDGGFDVFVGAPNDASANRSDLLPWNRIGSVVRISGILDQTWTQDVAQVVRRAGDVDGDGISDLLVSGWGRTVVYSGANAQVIHELELGATAVASAGDANADGYADLLLGVPDVAFAKRRLAYTGGVVYLFSGRDGALLHETHGGGPTANRGDRFGAAVDGVGDVDGDGCDDFVVGAPQSDQYGSSWNCWDWDPCSASPGPAGYARVYSGATGTVLHHLSGVPRSGELFGYSVAGVGDVDRDGVPDLAVGAPWAGPLFRGAVRVYSGSTGALLGARVGDPQDAFGFKVAGNASFDFDADGWPDIAAATQTGPRTSTIPGWGKVRVISGRTGSDLFSNGGGIDYEYGDRITFGYDLDSAGDFNGDGFSDLIIGDPPRRGPTGPAVGRVIVVSGADGSTLLEEFGGWSWDYLGYGVAGIGDVDGDGLDDVAMGAPAGGGFRSRNSSGIGHVRVRKGRP